MPTVTFSGYVLPRAKNITIHKFPTMTWNLLEPNLRTSSRISVVDGSVTIKSRMNREFAGDELTRLYTRVYLAVRTSLDVWAFASGQGYTLVLDSYTNSAGQLTELVIENLSLSAFCRSFSLDDPDFYRITMFFLDDPKLGWALKDLIEANTLPNSASINCARAVESLRVLMTGPTMDRGRAWGEFQASLRISREFRAHITDVSTGPRHGDRSPIPGEIALEVTRRAWQIMDRYIEYRKRGSQPLPEADFPLL